MEAILQQTRRAVAFLRTISLPWPPVPTMPLPLGNSDRHQTVTLRPASKAMTLDPVEFRTQEPPAPTQPSLRRAALAARFSPSPFCGPNRESCLFNSLRISDLGESSNGPDTYRKSVFKLPKTENGPRCRKSLLRAVLRDSEKGPAKTEKVRLQGRSLHPTSLTNFSRSP